MLLQEKYTVLWEYIREIPNSDLGMAGWGWGGGERISNTASQGSNM